MSLTQTDFYELRTIIKEEISLAIEPLYGKLEALENDIKDIYKMISGMQASTANNKDFSKLDLEKKLLKLNSELLSTAKQAGITLPR